MQISIEKLGAKRFWLLVAGVALAIGAGWKGLNYLDQNLAAARAYAKRDPQVIARVGKVDGTYLYRQRYTDEQENGVRCFADYFFFVTGERTGHVAVRVRACGARNEPKFTATLRQ
jgi:hypothetical protein